jgi:Undecaprenyl-phosphate galactose phosphotransferase WbaP
MSTVKVVPGSPVYISRATSSTDPHRPGLSAFCVLAADIVGLSITFWVFPGNTILGRGGTQGSWLPLWPLLPLFLIVYWLFDSYPGISVNSVDEIRRVVLANTTVFLFVLVMFALHHLSTRSLFLCLAACIGASFVILATRTTVRGFGSRFVWWGYPVVLFGSGAVALSVLRKLTSQPHLGLRPVAVVTDRVVRMEMAGVPVYRSEYLNRLACSGVRHAIVAAPELSQSEFAEVLERGSDAFPHLILIPNTEFIWRVGSYTRDLMGILGVHVHNNLLSRGSRIAKRMIDLTCATALAILLLPIIAVISLFVAVESGFPVFYSQERLGHGGQTFHIWKFRTMVRNSAEVLEQCLANRPELRQEWTENRKLRKDPRLTRVGGVLRKASLDELPQLWNVIKGDMSLVGPRPIIDAEVVKYQESYSLYTKITPGLTGLWQVSGRNSTTYAERVAFDTYYVRNWSVWMDVYLLAKTVSVVLTGRGAY